MAVQKGAVSKNDMKFGNISAVMALKGQKMACCTHAIL
jgi:hypothetical protein